MPAVAPPSGRDSSPASASSSPAEVPAPPPATATPIPVRPIIQPPLLASDILREEVAPLAPARPTLRGLLLPLAVGFAAWGAASFAGLLAPGTPLTVTSALVTSAAATLAVLTPAPYAARAIFAALIGLLPLVVGARGQGALGSLAFEDPLQAGAGVVLATLLPAALFFRSQYRAFPAARGMLAGAILLAGPALLFLAEGTFAEGATLEVRAMDGLLIAACLTSLGGFLGPETKGGCAAGGALLLLTYAGRIFVTTWLKGGRGLTLAAMTGVGAGLSAAVASVGLYQLLAAMFAGRARLVDVHRIVGPSAE
jgi:hypothetical protein